MGVWLRVPISGFQVRKTEALGFRFQPTMPQPELLREIPRIREPVVGSLSAIWKVEC